MHTRRTLAAILLAAAAAATMFSAWVVPDENGAWMAATDPHPDENEIRVTVLHEPGDFEVRIPALNRCCIAADASRLEDLQGTLDVYAFQADNGRTLVRADPEHMVFHTDDAFSPSTFQFRGAPPEPADRYGDTRTLYFVWQISGAAEITIDSMIDHETRGEGIGGRIVLMPADAALRYGSAQAVTGTAIAAAFVLTVLPSRRPAPTVDDGAMGMSIGLAQQGEWWLRQLRASFMTSTSILFVTLVLFTGITWASTTTAVTHAGFGASQPYPSWGLLQKTLILALDACALVLAGAAVVRVQAHLRTWRAKASKVPIEGELAD